MTEHDHDIEKITGQRERNSDKTDYQTMRCFAANGFSQNTGYYRSQEG